MMVKKFSNNICGLSNRELEVINTICEKKIYKIGKVAEELKIERSTVVTHLINIYNKTNAVGIAGIVDFYWSELRAK